VGFELCAAHKATRSFVGVGGQSSFCTRRLDVEQTADFPFIAFAAFRLEAKGSESKNHPPSEVSEHPLGRFDEFLRSIFSSLDNQWPLENLSYHQLHNPDRM
jgi:hypothetical protein